MMFYVHIGMIIDGNDDSNIFLDKWIHSMDLWKRLDLINFVEEM